eukprot:m.65407 g.65407  ORF g.65407 m.65407 type:complete len:207 (+) comp11734_c0_seq7:255-875(+)
MYVSKVGAWFKSFFLLKFSLVNAYLEVSNRFGAIQNLRDPYRCAHTIDQWEDLLRQQEIVTNTSAPSSSPTYLDIAFYAQCQTIFSGLSEELANEIARRPLLRSHIQNMNHYFSDYRDLNYCARLGLPSGSQADSRPMYALDTLPLKKATALQTLVTLCHSASLAGTQFPLFLLFLSHDLWTRGAEATGKKLHPNSYWHRVLKSLL